ncbi:MAG: hypothetical protein JNK49_06915 [Planctomycetes bacterium]|nr:hypothetical protein [Planctomycetota bacterium]
MTPPALPAPLPSWRWPLVLGVLCTVLLHLPVLHEHLLWVSLPASFGVTGVLCGVLPAWLVLRREAEPSLRTGFAAGFTAVGAGILALAIGTLWQGFTISVDQTEPWREELLRNELSPAMVDEFFARLRGGEGEVWVVLAAAFVAFGGGMGGALVAALRVRRQRRAARRAGG